MCSGDRTSRDEHACACGKECRKEFSIRHDAFVSTEVNCRGAAKAGACHVVLRCDDDPTVTGDESNSMLNFRGFNNAEHNAFGASKVGGSVIAVECSGRMTDNARVTGDLGNDAETSCVVGSGTVTGNVIEAVCEVVDHMSLPMNE